MTESLPLYVQTNRRGHDSIASGLKQELGGFSLKTYSNLKPIQPNPESQTCEISADLNQNPRNLAIYLISNRVDYEFIANPDLRSADLV